jgi:hypothetical protein
MGDSRKKISKWRKQGFVTPEDTITSTTRINKRLKEQEKESHERLSLVKSQINILLKLQ